MTSFLSPSLSKTLSLGAVLALATATGLWAQETPAPAAPAEGTVTADAPSADGLSMGAEVGADGQPAADGVGSTYIEAKFEAWEQRCVRTEDGADPCQLYQLLKDADGNAVAEFSLFNLPAGGQAAAGATVIVPLETLLPENLLIAVDGAKAKIYPYTFCSSIGCVSRIGFTAEEIAGFKKGAKATLTIVPVVAPDQKVQVDISLKGFTAGYEAVSKTNP